MTTTKRHQLGNGLAVVIEDLPNASAAAVNLWYGVGSGHEQPGRTGLAHLFEHLMFQGSAQVERGEHFAALQPLGATQNATTFFDRTNYFETVPPEALDLALWLEADRMGGLLDRLDQANVDNQRDVVKNERRQRLDSVPYGTSFEYLVAALFPDTHPYHHSAFGSMADLDAASLGDVRAFFTRFYAPNNACLSLVGNVGFDVLCRVEYFFGGIAPAPVANAPAREPLAPLPETVRIDVPEDVPAAAVIRAWRAPADGERSCDAVELVVRVLGGGLGSRLARGLTRGLDITTTASADLIRLVRGNSMVIAEAKAVPGIDSGALADALDEELTMLCEHGPTEIELAGAQAGARAERMRGTATLGGRADLLSRYECLFGDARLAEDHTRRLRSITADEVRDVAQQWLRPDSAVSLSYQAGTR